MEDRERILNSENPYQALLLPTTSNLQEAKLRYFELVKRFSPEKEEKCFSIIRKAYDDLQDPAKKAAADVMLFTGGRGDVRFDGVRIETASEVKINREIEEYSSRDHSTEEEKLILILAYKQRALLLSKKRGWREILDCLHELEKITGMTKDIETNLAFVLGKIAYEFAGRGEYADACQRWNRAASLDPGNSEILHNIAVCATLMGNAEEKDKYWVETLKAWKRDLISSPDELYIEKLIAETHKRFGNRYLHATGFTNSPARNRSTGTPVSKKNKKVSSQSKKRKKDWKVEELQITVYTSERTTEKSTPDSPKFFDIRSRLARLRTAFSPSNRKG